MKGDNVKTYVKIPVLTTDHHYYGKKGKWIDDIIDTLSSKKLDRSGTVRRLTKALVRRDRSAVLDGLEDMNVCVMRPMDPVTEAAMWKALPAVGETRVVSWVRDAVAPEPLPPAVSHIPDLGEGRDDPTLTGPAVEL